MIVNAVIKAGAHPYHRKASVDLHGEQVWFWIENHDHPEFKVGTQVQVRFDPADQFAKIVCPLEE